MGLLSMIKFSSPWMRLLENRCKAHAHFPKLWKKYSKLILKIKDGPICSQCWKENLNIGLSLPSQPREKTLYLVIDAGFKSPLLAISCYRAGCPEFHCLGLQLYYSHELFLDLTQLNPKLNLIWLSEPKFYLALIYLWAISKEHN